MTVEQNVAILRSKARRAPADNKDRIEKIVSLYSMRKIRDIRPAQLMVVGLAGDECRRNPNAVLDRDDALVAKLDRTDTWPQLVPLPERTPEPPTIDVPRRTRPPSLPAAAAIGTPALVGVHMALACMLAAFAIGISFNHLGRFLFG